METSVAQVWGGAVTVIRKSPGANPYGDYRCSSAGGAGTVMEKIWLVPPPLETLVAQVRRGGAATIGRKINWCHPLWRLKLLTCGDGAVAVKKKNQLVPLPLETIVAQVRRGGRQ